MSSAHGTLFAIVRQLPSRRGARRYPRRLRGERRDSSARGSGKRQRRLSISSPSYRE